MIIRSDRGSIRGKNLHRRTGRLGLVLAMALLPGCENLLGIRAPESESKLAVYGFLNPDERVVIDLYRSASLDEAVTEEALRLDDALVIVTSTTQRDTLVRTAPGRYEANRLPRQEEGYAIEVQKTGFDTVRGECVVPKRPVTRVRVAKQGETESSKQFRVTLQLDDPPGAHVYRMGLFLFLEPDSRQNDTPWAAKFFSSSNTALRADPADVGGQPLETNPVEFDVVYFSDDTMEAQTGEFVLNVELRSSNSLEVSLVVTSMDSAYFEYHKSLSLQRRNLEDPFAEPVTVFSNVENGLGVVGCYANQATTVRFQ